jgi:hypothetical protein
MAIVNALEAGFMEEDGEMDLTPLDDKVWHAWYLLGMKLRDEVEKWPDEGREGIPEHMPARPL